MKTAAAILNSALRGCLLPALLLFGSQALFAQSDELLPPEQAFAMVAHMDGESLLLDYEIADGYYMYRERFDFQVESANARFGPAVMRDGKVKHDEFFGETEVYRDRLRIELPILTDRMQAIDLLVKTTGQGCADIGVCYPPLNQSLHFNTASRSSILPVAYSGQRIDANEMQNVAELQALIAQANTGTTDGQSAEIDPSPGASDALNLLLSIGDSIGLSNEDDIPHPDVAFQLSAVLDGDRRLQSDIELYPNTYLYRDKFDFKIVEGRGHSLGKVNLPPGDIKNDEFFGRMEVYHDWVQVSLPVVSQSDASDSYTLAYSYQGCVEDRICYPPINKYLKVSLGKASVAISDSAAGDNATKTDPTGSSLMPSIAEVPLSEQDQYARILQDKGLLLIIFLFFLGGIGLTFTPCVFPMIPILSSIIAGQGESIGTRKAFVLSLVYVLSMAVTYAIIGAIVGFYGAEYNIQIWFQDPYILSFFATVFVLLALSMFGFYDIQMPSGIQTRLASISHSQQGGSLIGVGIMGSLSAVIVGPCITAPLVGALIFISQTQNWQLGGLALFALGLGMGVPLMLVGTSAGKLLPRAGIWMDRVKKVFGVVMLALAIWLLERFLPTDIIMLLIAILAMTSAIYMGALETLGSQVSGWQKLNKGLGVILLLYGATYLIGAAAGSKDLVQPLKGVFNANSTVGPASANRVVFRQIKGEAGLQQALQNSVRQNTPSMLDFYADWCISCKEMEKYAFTHPAVVEALGGVNSFQADVTDNDAIDIQLMNAMGIYGPPAILFFDTDGQEIRHRRVVGEMSGEEFAAHLSATFQ